jgi:hypothetical protein
VDSSIVQFVPDGIIQCMRFERVATECEFKIQIPQFVLKKHYFCRGQLLEFQRRIAAIVVPKENE